MTETYYKLIIYGARAIGFADTPRVLAYAPAAHTARLSYL